MKVLITGAAGFLGSKLTKALLDSSLPISEMRLFDIVAPPEVKKDGVKVVTSAGDIADPVTVNGLVQGGVDLVVHLAAVVSAQAEADFDLGMRVNLDGLRIMLEACRHAGTRPRFIFTSSVAVFGGDLPEVIPDDLFPTPKSSYGAQKLVGEVLVGEYSRRGFIDGRALRLPTIVVRPGKPNKAASTFASSIIREPLQGDPAVCPVPGDTLMWLASPRQTIKTLMHAITLDEDKFKDQRIVNMVGLTVTVNEMLEALQRKAGEEVYKRVTWEPDGEITRIIQSWPGRFASTRGKELGFTAEGSFAEIIDNFIADDMIKP